MTLAWVPSVARNLAVGLELTLLMSLLTAAASTVLGLVLGSASTLQSRAVTVPIRAYVELWQTSHPDVGVEVLAA